MELGAIETEVIVLIGVLAILAKMAIGDIISKINK